jgi:hypothetical protein
LDKSNNTNSPPAFENVILLLTIAIIPPLALWFRDLLPIEEEVTFFGAITVMVLILLLWKLLLKRFRRHRAFNAVDIWTKEISTYVRKNSVSPITDLTKGVICLNEQGRQYEEQRLLEIREHFALLEGKGQDVVVMATKSNKTLHRPVNRLYKQLKQHLRQIDNCREALSNEVGASDQTSALMLLDKDMNASNRELRKEVEKVMADVTKLKQKVSLS